MRKNKINYFSMFILKFKEPKIINKNNWNKNEIKCKQQKY